jgi:ABC-type lipoprotein export system ATPase subunit
MNTHIAQVELLHYRSCKRTRVELQGTLSALIGPNGSGKTNFLKGLLLLRKLGRQSRYRADDEVTQSSCKLRATFVVDGKLLPFEALIRYTTNERNVDEVISAKQTWNLQEFARPRRPLKISFSNYREFREWFHPPGAGEAFGRFPAKDLKAFLKRRFGVYYGPNQRIGIKELSTFTRVLDKAHEFMTGISYYSASQFTDPSKCPTHFEIDEDSRLRRFATRAGDEHVQFMHDLYSAYKDPESKYKEFLSIVGSDGVSLIEDIEYTELDVPANTYKVEIGGRIVSKETKRVWVIPNFLLGSERLSPNQLSEGTFKTLAVVFYLVTDTSRLLLLEEPEVCVHHGLLSSIIELIKLFSLQKQIVLSTHSDFVLDGLQPENVFVVSNDAKRGTIIKHISKALSSRDYRSLRKYLNESGNLGEYWRHGELEQ